MMSAHGSFSLGKGFPGSLDASQLLCNLTAASSASCWLFYFLVRLESCDGQTGRHARLKYFYGYCMQQVQVEGCCRHGTARHSTAQHGTAWHSMAQHGTAQHSTAQHGTARHSTAQHGTARHSTATCQLYLPHTFLCLLTSLPVQPRMSAFHLNITQTQCRSASQTSNPSYRAQERAEGAES